MLIACAGTAVAQDSTENQPPTAGITVSDDTPHQDQQLTFEADASDPDGTVEAIAWDFGDGDTSTEPKLTHTYTAEGEYTVSLTVTDDAGAETTSTMKLDVHPRPMGAMHAMRTIVQGLLDDLKASMAEYRKSLNNVDGRLSTIITTTESQTQAIESGHAAVAEQLRQQTAAIKDMTSALQAQADAIQAQADAVEQLAEAVESRPLFDQDKPIPIWLKYHGSVPPRREGMKSGE